MTPEDRLMQLQHDGVQFMRLKSLVTAFDDLTVVVDDNGRSHSCTAQVNNGVDGVDFRQHERGEDGPLVVWPYVLLPIEGKVYSSPPCFTVAHPAKNGFGEVPVKGWETDMREEGVSEDVIRKVRQYLERHPPVFYGD